MRISVALATYNGERWIREQLNSLTNQSLLPYELVISDDNSGDRTLDVVEQFAAAAPFPVRIARNDNRLGFADNFINALRHCTGDAVAFYLNGIRPRGVLKLHYFASYKMRKASQVFAL